MLAAHAVHLGPGFKVTYKLRGSRGLKLSHGRTSANDRDREKASELYSRELHGSGFRE